MKGNSDVQALPPHVAGLYLAFMSSIAASLEMRWLGVAIALLAVARPGERWWLLAGHLALAYAALERRRRAADSSLAADKPILFQE